jgi:hypothetical protein
VSYPRGISLGQAQFDGTTPFGFSLGADAARASHQAASSTCAFVARLTTRQRRAAWPCACHRARASTRTFLRSRWRPRGRRFAPSRSRHLGARRLHRRRAGRRWPSAPEGNLYRTTRIRARWRALPLAAELTSLLRPLLDSRHDGEIASTSYPASASRTSQASWQASWYAS